MTNPFLTLDRASLSLPDGRILFSDLDLQLDGRPTGLVGRNGVGKSVLARLLAGEIAPTSGKRNASGRVHYLPQQIHVPDGATVASLAGVDAWLDALARIEAGSTAVHDFDTWVNAGTSASDSHRRWRRRACRISTRIAPPPRSAVGKRCASPWPVCSCPAPTS